MKIVIDVPEDEYQICLSHRESIESMIRVHKCFSLEYAVVRGTPLPKGHGRLIDADMVCDEFENKSFSTSSDYHNAIDAVDDAPTIIEADKAHDGGIQHERP